MVRLIVILSLCIIACTAVKTACDSYYSSDFRDEARQCSGQKVKQVPQSLPRGLQMLVLTDTAIPSLDRDSFQRRHLSDVTTLYITGGRLTRVGEHAFCALPALTMLYLDHNRLDTLDELSFSCNQHLRTVSLVGNPSFRHLPPLVSPSVEHLYLDNCSLANIDVATVQGMTALKVLSLTGNPDLHCPSVEAQFKQARSELRVICKDPAADVPSSVSHHEHEKSLYETDSTNTEKDSTVTEENTSEESHNGSDSAMKNKNKEITANAASRIRLSVPAVAGISILIIISI